MNPTRATANKSVKSDFIKSIELSLTNESVSVKRNTKTFNSNRYKTVSLIENYENLKDKARSIKESAIKDLPSSIENLTTVIEQRGGKVFLAKTPLEANEYIYSICRRKNARFIVKGKSMTTEEIKLNEFLISRDIEVAETDLAEYLLQLTDEQPSHIVAPAIHMSRESISKLFKEKYFTDEELETGEQLTKFARKKLRDKFLSADIGITGANFIAADTGTLMLVESEGNIRLSYSLPPVHIAVAGIEKVIQKFDDLAVFTELLAASATGQRLTSYTSFINPPLKKIPADTKSANPDSEFHLVLIDNGRSKLRQDPFLAEGLYCIRCSACLNSCSNFQSVGGHAFGGETYSGGIGSVWEAATGQLEKANFNELCTGCSRCVPQCPVKIDIPWLNEVVRDRLNNKEKGLIETIFSPLLKNRNNKPPLSLNKFIFSNFTPLAKAGSLTSIISNKILASSFSRIISEKFINISAKRIPLQFEHETLESYSTKNKVKKDYSPNLEKLFIFNDIYSNYMYKARGKALLSILKRLNFHFELGEPIDDGRSSLSQGKIKTATNRAKKTSAVLVDKINKGYKILVLEPSVLAMFRRDYKHLIISDLFEKIRDNSFDTVEFLNDYFYAKNINVRNIFKPPDENLRKVFIHGHCQLKTVGAFEKNISFLKNIGFDLIIAENECCGMAGSFGYKKEYFELSMRSGEDLFNQINSFTDESPPSIITSGISCREQIKQGTNNETIHPIELLAKLL